MATKYLSSISRRTLIGISVLVFSLQPIQVFALDEEFYSGNDILYYNPEACKINTDGSASLVGNDNAEKIWNYLVGQGLSAEQAAGVLGNIQAESGFNPGIEESTPRRDKGYGIVQWTFERRDRLEEAAREKGVDASDLAFQLEFLFEELNARPTNRSEYRQFSNEWEMLMGQNNIEDALVAFHHEFEISHLMDTANPRQAVIDARGKFAQDAYASFKDNVPSGSTASTGGTAPTIFIDPGHGGAIAPYVDQKSGLRTAETHNMPETADALDVANRVKAELEKIGYKVVLARSSNDQKITFRERADAAAAAKASIGVSIHTTPGDINEAWPQRVNTSRTYNGKTDTFGDTEEEKKTATKSEAFASAFAKARTEAEGHPVDTDEGNQTQSGSFNRDGISSKGNIPLIALWSPTVPWVYNEIGQDQGTGISEKRKAAYAKGIIEGVKQAVPFTGDAGCGDQFAGGDLSATTLAYAWPEYKGETIVPTDAYKDKVIDNHAPNRYIGGIAHPGIDCGGFVTNLLIDSGFEPEYNYGGDMSNGAGNTTNQQAWMRENWQSLGTGGDISAADLQPGDVAINGEHTFVFVGEIPGFDSDIASASLDERAPMAGTEQITNPGMNWYRKK